MKKQGSGIDPPEDVIGYGSPPGFAFAKDS